MVITKYVIYKGKKKMVQDLSPKSNYKVDVQCPECGEIRNVYYKSICKAGNCMCRSCSVKIKLGKPIDVGTVFDRLVVIEPSEKSGYSICQCECGGIAEVENWNLRNNKTRSCGCLRSETMKKIMEHPTDEKHWNWQGGKTKERNSVMSKKSYNDWREDVFRRDGYTCRKCGQVGRVLNAHHIESFSANVGSRLDVDNGITLCHKCHKEYHKKYKFDSGKKEMAEFLCKVIYKY